MDWTQLSTLLAEDGDKIQSPKYCVLNKSRMMDNVQKHNNYINIPSSQTFRSYLQVTVFMLKRNAVTDFDGSDSLLDTTPIFTSMTSSFLE
jgi:hypothetical protein